jgi:hypothetical protein
MVILTIRPLCPRYVLDRRLDWLQSRSGCGGEDKKKSLPCTESNLGRPARSLVTILTELPQRLKAKLMQSCYKSSFECSTNFISSKGLFMECRKEKQRPGCRAVRHSLFSPHHEIWTVHVTTPPPLGIGPLRIIKRLNDAIRTAREVSKQSDVTNTETIKVWFYGLFCKHTSV